MPSPHQLRRLLADWSPYGLADTAARYSLAGPASDSTYIIDGSNRLQLIADRSGNSAVNGLVLNGVSGNYASTPDAAPVRVIGDIDIRALIQLPSWATSQQSLVGKWGAAGHRTYLFSISGSGNSGKLEFDQYVGSSVITSVSSVTTGFAAFTKAWLRVTFSASTGIVKFYTSSDGVTWTQLGTDISGTASNNDASDEQVTIGGHVSGAGAPTNGIFYRAQIYNGINGTLVFDADFSKPAKLASSFTESSANAATVTVNVSGALGARICGARDRVGLAQANQAIVSTLNGLNVATYDGSNDYDGSAAFSLSQPVTRYTVFKIPSWSSGKVLWTGVSASAKFYQTGSTPGLTLNAGSDGPALSTFTLDTLAVVAEVINGASSTLGRNLDARTSTANAGSNNPAGLIVGADTAGANNAPLVWCETIVRSVADDTTMQTRIASFLLRKWGITP